METLSLDARRRAACEIRLGVSPHSTCRRTRVLEPRVNFDLRVGRFGAMRTWLRHKWRQRPSPAKGHAAISRNTSKTESCALSPTVANCIKLLRPWAWQLAHGAYCARGREERGIFLGHGAPVRLSDGRRAARSLPAAELPGSDGRPCCWLRYSEVRLFEMVSVHAGHQKVVGGLQATPQVQANLVMLPGKFAEDFKDFCPLEPVRQPCLADPVAFRGCLRCSKCCALSAATWA